MHLLKGAGAFRQLSAVNPQALVPVLTDLASASASVGVLILEEKYPGVPLLPADAVERSRVLQIALRSPATAIHHNLVF